MCKHSLKTLLLLGTMVLWSCKQSGEETAAEQSLMQDSSLSMIPVSEEVINTIVESMPAPLEISATLKAGGAAFIPSLLNPVSEVEHYIGSHEKAFGLGRYGADLAYLNIYEKSGSAISYLNVIRKLAGELMIGPFFDFELLRRLSGSNRNIDSLLNISTSNFNAMDRHLREKKRGHLSVLMVAGAWLEGAYIASSVAVKNRQQAIVEKVGEQKMILDQLMIILGAFDKDPFFRQLKKEFSRLHEVYKEVSIKTEYREPLSKEENGKLVIVDNSVSTIVVPDSTLTRIHEILSEIRSIHSHHQL